MTTAIQEPCDMAQCPGCTSRTCTSRAGGVSSGTRTPPPVLIPEQALTVRRAYYDSDQIDGNGC